MSASGKPSSVSDMAPGRSSPQARSMHSMPAPLTTESKAHDHLFAARTVLIFGEITQELAERTCRDLLALAHVSHAPIRILINSPGGHVESGDSIHDLIRFIEPPVQVVGSGWVASAGALIFAAAERERRIALPNTRFMLHEPSGGVRGPASDVEIEVEQILQMRDRLSRVFAAATGQPLQRIVKDISRNHWLSSSEAQEYGLVGRIVEHVTELDREPPRPQS
jgi:ATP-dependent Clp protease, protease subunit